MKIPESFKRAIERTFYDKTLWLCQKVVQTDSLGAVVATGYEPILSFKGSFQPNVSGANVDEYGNQASSGFRIACSLSPSEVKKLEHVVQYNGQYYEIEGVFPTDSALVMNVVEVGK